jgi:hypothetical protein
LPSATIVTQLVTRSPVSIARGNRVLPTRPGGLAR